MTEKNERAKHSKLENLVVVPKVCIIPTPLKNEGGGGGGVSDSITPADQFQSSNPACNSFLIAEH